MKQIKIKASQYEEMVQTFMYDDKHVISAEFISHPDMRQHSICKN